MPEGKKGDQTAGTTGELGNRRENFSETGGPEILKKTGGFWDVRGIRPGKRKKENAREGEITENARRKHGKSKFARTKSEHVGKFEPGLCNCGGTKFRETNKGGGTI